MQERIRRKEVMCMEWIKSFYRFVVELPQIVGVLLYYGALHKMKQTTPLCTHSEGETKQTKQEVGGCSSQH